MNKYNWDYKELGFESETEMTESIERVERKLNMTREERVREEKQKRFTRRNEGFSFEAMNEGVRLERLDGKVQQRIIFHKEHEKRQAEREASQKRMNSLGEMLAEENKVNAQRELDEEKKKLEEDLQKEVYSKHNVNTDKEQELNDSLMGMLKNSKHISQK